MTHPAREEIRIGISSCLLGQRVRYDGGHKRDPMATVLLAPFVTFVPVCPEVELGLGTPREPIRLVRRDGRVRLVATRSGRDHTQAMRRFAGARLRELERLDLSGYLLKKGSPSCGMERVLVWGEGGRANTGRGLFALALLERMPLLPVEEEGRLHDDALRENFLERVFAYRRLRELLSSRWRMDDLIRFHASEELLLLAHHPTASRELARVAARAGSGPRREIGRGFAETYLTALSRLAGPGRHAVVLRRMASRLEGLTTPSERRELSEAIADYRRRRVPRGIPLTLLRRQIQRHGVDYPAGQRYLEPYPRGLMLRDGV